MGESRCRGCGTPTPRANRSAGARDRRPRLRRGGAARADDPAAARVPPGRFRSRAGSRSPTTRARTRTWPIACRLAAELDGVARVRLDAEGPRAGAARRLVGERRATSSPTWTSTCPPTSPRCSRSSRRSSPGTATSRSARRLGRRRAGRARPEARGDLAQLQPAPARDAARALLRRAVRLQGDPRRPRPRAAAAGRGHAAGSSTPSCSCSPSAPGCGSTRCRSTGSTTPTRRVDIVATALADLRGIARLAPRPRTAAAGRRARAAGRRPPPASSCRAGAALRRRSASLSTLAYLLLYVLLRAPLGAQAANCVALLLTAVANTAANRRLTFGVRGRGRRRRAPGRGARRVRARRSALTSRLARRCSTRSTRTRRAALELAVLVVANARGDRRSASCCSAPGSSAPRAAPARSTHDRHDRPSPTDAAGRRVPRRRTPRRTRRVARPGAPTPRWVRPALLGLLAGDRPALPGGLGGLAAGRTLLLGRRAGRHAELEGVLLRLVRRLELHHGRQAARRRCG